MERYCLYYISGLLSIFYCFLICMGVLGRVDTYRYNLELFKEIKRFWNYRDQSRLFCYVYKFIRECSNLCPVWIFYAHGEQIQKLSFLHCFIALD